MENYHDLELSEEFLINILKYVDELCNTISNGDPILERTMIINQNLINSVSFYRGVLEDVKNKPEDMEYFNENEALSDHDQGTIDLEGGVTINAVRRCEAKSLIKTNFLSSRKESIQTN